MMKTTWTVNGSKRNSKDTTSLLDLYIDRSSEPTGYSVLFPTLLFAEFA